jgi:hypothetical protein
VNDQLDFGGAVVASSQKVHSEGMVTALVLLAIAAYLGIVVVTIWYATVDSRRGHRLPFSLDTLPSAVKLVCLGICASSLLVQGLGAADAYMQTRVVQPSAYDYFQYMSWARILGMSHAHLFGFMVLYGALALLFAISSAPEKVKHLLIPVVLWAGVFDVLSWYGMKGLSGRFEWLAMVTGASNGLSSVAIVFFILKDLRPRLVTQ